MPEVTDQPAKSMRTWRPITLWSAGIVLTLGSIWVIVAAVSRQND